MSLTGVDPDRLRDVDARERRAFAAAHTRSDALWRRAQRSMPNGVPMSWMRCFSDVPPVFVEDGRGARFRDADGNEYADFNLADISMFCGYAPAPVVEAVSRRVARGSQFMLANEDALWVAEELGRRYRRPKWQFTLAASQANTEALRVARTATGRDKLLVFDGKYHGHFDDVLVELRDGRVVPEERGLPPTVTGRTKIVQFNDLDGLRAALEPGDVALVLTEPALTNVVGLLLPEADFHAGVRRITRETGTLLAYDETHTQVMGPGGLTRLWELESDFVTMGKSVAAGVPLGAYGMTDEVAATLTLDAPVADGHQAVATGGTLYGNPLSLAAARAALGEVLTDEAYAHSQRMGERLDAGIAAAIERSGLPWTALHLGPRAGCCFAPARPRTALDAYRARDVTLSHAMWVYLANRGVWDAVVGAGPTCSIPTSPEDVDRYVDAFGSFLEAIAG